MSKAKRLREQKGQERERQRQEASAAASLDGPIAKLDRAKTHLHTLHKSVGAYKRTKSHEFPVTKFDPETGEKVLSLRILKHPKNPEWGLILGDVIHNLRAALDHLVWQLVILNGEKPRRQNAFPIIGTKSEYWEVSKGHSESVRDYRLRGVAEDHRAFIDIVQPFIAGDDPQTALVHLSWLSNTDKHRVIHGGFVLTEEPSLDMLDVTTSKPGGVPVEVGGEWGRLKDGAEVLWFRPLEPDADVSMNAKIPTYIAFGDSERQYPQEAIVRIFNWVSDYVRGFEPIFRGELRTGKGSPIQRAPGS